LGWHNIQKKSHNSSGPVYNFVGCNMSINCNCQGVCERQVHDTIQRLWDIIENITVDRLGRLFCFILAMSLCISQLLLSVPVLVVTIMILVNYTIV